MQKKKLLPPCPHNTKLGDVEGIMHCIDCGQNVRFNGKRPARKRPAWLPMKKK